MASTISSINAALVDNRVVKALRYVLPMLQTFSFGVWDMAKRGRGAVIDDSVYVPIATDPSVATKTPGTIAAGSGALAGTQVTLDTPIAAGWDAKEGNMPAEMLGNYWADKAAGAIYQLAKTVVDAALGLITSSNFSNTEGTDKLTVAAADFGQNDLALLWQYAATKIKQQGLSLGLNASYAGSLMGESNLALIFANSGDNFVRTGILPQLIGMNTWAYPAFPANSESLGGAVIGKAALLIGAGPLDPLMQAGDGDVVERRIITDPETGLSALYTVVADGGGILKGECAMVYGVDAGQNAVVRLVSA